MDKQLPDFIIPQLYKLILRPNLQTLHVNGTEVVTIEVKKETSKIKMHALDVDILLVVLFDGEKQQSPTEIKRKDGCVSIYFKDKIMPGSVDIKFEFKSNISKEPKGFFLSKYNLEDGMEIVTAATNFFPKCACMCFPCWDDPIFLAPVQLTVVSSAGNVVLSNMPVNTTSVKQGMTTHDFQTTPSILIDKLAIVIGCFDVVEEKTENQKTIRIFTYKNNSSDGIYASKVISKALPFFEKYFDLPYTLPKLDYVPLDTVPRELSNLGLILCRSDALFVARDSSVKYKQKVALEIVHALVLIWFGNIVSMRSNEDAWVWDWMASFFKYVCLGRLYPSFGIWLEFTSKSDRDRTLDAFSNNPYPLVRRAMNNKSTAIFNMLYHYLEDDRFQFGIEAYVNKYKYKVSTIEELWNYLEDMCRLPITKIIKSWTDQPGMPVLFCSMFPKNDYFILKIRQRKFLKDGHIKGKSPLWKLPIAVYHCDNGLTKVAGFILDSICSEIIIPNNNATGCIFIHPGYFRVSYSKYMLKKFQYYIGTRDLPSIDRLSILLDLFEIVQKGYTCTIELIELLRCYENETDFRVWLSICNILNILNCILHHFPPEAKDNFKMFTYTLMNKIYTKLGWEESSLETDNEKNVRSLVLGHLAKFNNSDFINKAVKKYVDMGHSLPSSLQYPVYKVIVRTKDLEVFDSLRQMYLSTNDNLERTNLCKAFGASDNIDFLKKVLDFATSPQCTIRDGIMIITHTMTNGKVGNITGWSYTKENYAKILKKFHAENIWYFVNAMEVHIANDEIAADIEHFFSQNHDIGLGTYVHKVVRTASIRSEWWRRDQTAISSYFFEEFENVGTRDK